VAMNVTVTNVRNSPKPVTNAVFDVVVTYGTQVETYRGVSLDPLDGRLPGAAINALSHLISASAGATGWGTAIATVPVPPISITYATPAGLATGFSSADFLTNADGGPGGVFDANSSLDNVEIFNLLMVPGVTDNAVVSAALAFAERKRAFAIIDPPPQAPAFGSSASAPEPIADWMSGLPLSGISYSLPVSQNGALYFPYLVSTDLITGKQIPMPPSGFVAGIYAQTDASRGVWKAPAGLATTVLNTAGPVPSGVMNDPQQGVLNLDSINCLRHFSGIGTVVWGARTLVANNQAFAQSMYVPVRRMTLFIEQTLVANLRWVVFEPNDDPLWTAIRASIEAFLLSLFRQGALQGSTPSQAFQVLCDSTTTSPTDQQNGIVNIVVAFAPLKPAEFVIIQIAQLAGQTAT
jgi:phage tail sheath protein FI